jgi:hypothetical protein
MIDRVTLLGECFERSHNQAADVCDATPLVIKQAACSMRSKLLGQLQIR